MSRIKLIIIGIVSLIFIGSIGTIWYQHTEIIKITEQLEWQTANYKAYEAENSKLKNSNIQFQYTIDQLNYSQDSLVQKLNEARKTLKIKDKNIKELEYIASHNLKKDSIYIRDTIFRDVNFSLDSLIENEWAALKLHLEYPGNIEAEYSFNNSVIVTASSKRETIMPPKKTWLCRLFQKKHTVIEVDVVQENPYCVTDIRKHIKIVE